MIDHNKGKQGVDTSDQLSSYFTCLRKSLKWFKKIAIEVICGALFVNTFVLYNSVCLPQNQLSMLQIWQSLIHSLLEIVKQDTEPRPDISNKKKTRINTQTAQAA